MLFKNILVPYDGSKCSNHACKVGLDIAKKYDSKITIISCIDTDVGPAWYGFDSRVGNEILKKHKKAIESDVKNFQELAKKTKVPYSFEIIETKSIPKTIISFSKTKKIDLIVMGSHGRKGFSKLLLGSVANAVSQQSRSPVLILK
jgi:nucleotide-binding universal stress UspA family protein